MKKEKVREEYGLKILVNGETYNEYKGTLQEQIEELQERIDKAIEYLDWLFEHNPYAETDNDYEEFRKLREILKGGE